MKLRIMAALALAVAAISSPALANAQQQTNRQMPRVATGVGPAVSGSVKTLPKSALNFIVEYYPAAGITEMDKEFMTGNYEVKFEDGTEIEFDKNGKVIEIDADDSIIPENVVKAVVTPNVYKQIKAKNQANCIESIEKKGNGYKIEVRDTEFFYN